MAISEKSGEGEESKTVELPNYSQPVGQVGQPTAPLLPRSSWVENFGLWKQRSFRQNNNSDHENRRTERRYKAPSGPPPPIPKRNHSVHEYESTQPPVYGRLATSINGGSKLSPIKSSLYTNNRNSSSSIDFRKIAIILGVACFILLTLSIALLIYSFSGHRRVESGDMSLTETKWGHASPSQLIFYDDFDTLNLTTWRHDRYISTDGFVMFGSSRNNSYTENGILFIKPTLTNDTFDYPFFIGGTLKIGKTVEQEEGCSSFIASECEKRARGYSYHSILNPIISATLKTSQSFTFKYGTIEIRAKMPKGDWITTEISLMPRYNYYGEPPTNTEKITLIFTRGNSEYTSYVNRTNYGNERVCSQLIYTDSDTAAPTVTEFCTNTLSGQGFGEQFHIFKYEWTKDFLKIFIDDKMEGKFVVVDDAFYRSNARHIAVHGDSEEDKKKVSFDQQFYLQLKLTIGEGYPDTGFRSNAKPWSKSDTAEQAGYRFWLNRSRYLPTWQNDSSALQIDYIRVKAL